MDVTEYDALVMLTPEVFSRLKKHYGRMLTYLPVRKVYLVGSREVGELYRKALEDAGFLAGEDRERMEFLDEDEILPFDAVYEVVKQRLEPILQGRELPRGVCAWYYQQFLKLSYAKRCQDEYYLTWDGDTIPCAYFSMFVKAGEDFKPCFDMKREHNPMYFEVMGRLVSGLEKVMEPSFISEHMLFKKSMVEALIRDIESNENYAGTAFWEKIMHAIKTEEVQESVFSEFETYGTYTALRDSSAYRLRSWHSFRLGGEFFDPDTITERDFAWLGHDFTAISFEKGHTVREDHKNLFDNPAYQEKLTARQMLEIAQEEFTEGYKEIW